MDFGLMLVGLIVLIAVMGGIAIVSTQTKEKFTKELVDITQDKRTTAVEDSSYAQRTNHMDPAPYPSDPLPGSETPFQVNQFKAYAT
jgi:hypothetical protein